MRFFFVLLTAFILFFQAAAQAENKEEPISVLILTSLSGEAASIGEAVQKGFTLGLEKLPPQLRNKLNVRYEDDKVLPNESVTAYKRARLDGIPKVVVTVSSGTSKGVAPLCEKDNALLVAIASSKDVVRERDWAVNFWVTPTQQTRVLRQDALQKGITRAARVTTVQEGFLSVKEEMDQGMADVVDFTLDEEFPLEVKDFRSFAARIQQRKDLQALYVLMMPGHVGVFAKQMRSLGVDLPLIGVESFEDIEEVKVSEGALIGQRFVSNATPSQDFLDEYRKRFPGASTWAAANAHDIALLIGEALKTGSSREHLRTFFHNVKDFTGATGTFSSSGDNRFTLPAEMRVVPELEAM